MMNQLEMRDVIQAAIDGKTIQSRERSYPSKGWLDRDAQDILFNFVAYDYRVKPETPEVLWFDGIRGWGHRLDAGVGSRQFVRLTPAVRAACEAAGIEVPEVQE